MKRHISAHVRSLFFLSVHRAVRQQPADAAGAVPAARGRAAGSAEGNAGQGAGPGEGNPAQR